MKTEADRMRSYLAANARHPLPIISGNIKTGSKENHPMIPTHQQELNYRQTYGKMLDIGDALRKILIQHTSARLPNLAVPENVAEKLREAQQAVYEAQRRLETSIAVKPRDTL